MVITFEVIRRKQLVIEYERGKKEFISIIISINTIHIWFLNKLMFYALSCLINIHSPFQNNELYCLKEQMVFGF